ncbi:MAG TPA: D-alanyl-D-alanine carboxypeptidase [Devosiaceae bacterium]
MAYRVATLRAGQVSRARFWRVLSAIFVALAVLAAQVPQVSAANSRYAAIVVDAKTGKTLYSSAADALRYPASITKVMTLYILFQELDAGRLKLSSKLTVSKYASGAPPTKLYLKPGSTISVEDAIKAVVTRSANDVARVIAENISGSESAFAKRMTATAHALGMSRTHYNNASGLPDKGQLTTVRDQARLGIAIFEHYPDYYKYFSTRSFRWGKGVIGNHNRLLGRVKGVDGIKTGYTNASGFNLLTSAQTGGHHVVVAAFGFDSGASRDAKVASLVNKYIGKTRTGTYLASAKIPLPSGVSRAGVAVASVAPLPRLAGRLPAPIPAPLPDEMAPDPVTEVASIDNSTDLGDDDTVVPIDLADFEQPQAGENDTPVATAATVVASVDRKSAPMPAAQPADLLGNWMSQTFDLVTSGAPSASAYQPDTRGAPVPPAAIGNAPKALDLMTSGAIKGTSVTDPGWVVQIGAAPNSEGAQRLLADATSKLSGLEDYRAYVERYETGGQVFYRARLAGFAGRDQARSMCGKLTAARLSCLAMPG